ncbi:MAG: ABC transporter substrate-binding protein, partial [Pseudomonadota bacterium]
MIDRRKLLGAAAIGTAGVAAAACGSGGSESAASGGPAVISRKTRLVMTTTWPKDLPGLGMAANRVAERIGALSGGQIEVTVYAANELVPAFVIHF